MKRLAIILSLLASSVSAQTVTYGFAKRIKYKKALVKTMKAFDKKIDRLEFKRVRFGKADIKIEFSNKLGGGGWFDSKNPDTIYLTSFGLKNKKIAARTMLHELGHLFGLGHNNNPLSIMYELNLNKATLLESDMEDFNNAINENYND